jgi:hypothetical protein
MLGFLGFLIASIVASPQRAQAACLRYEPDTVRILGKLTRRTFYGPPGFGEDPKHDAKEVGFYLESPVALCTLKSSDNEAKSGVKLVQLVLDSAGYARLRPRLGTSVALRGTLFAAITGHHHAPILLTVAHPMRVEP